MSVEVHGRWSLAQELRREVHAVTAPFRTQVALERAGDHLRLLVDDVGGQTPEELRHDDASHVSRRIWCGTLAAEHQIDVEISGSGEIVEMRPDTQPTVERLIGKIDDRRDLQLGHRRVERWIGPAVLHDPVIDVDVTPTRTNEDVPYQATVPCRRPRRECPRQSGPCTGSGQDQSLERTRRGRASRSRRGTDGTRGSNRLLLCGGRPVVQLRSIHALKSNRDLAVPNRIVRR